MGNAEWGDWGLQTSEKTVVVLFFCGYAAKKQNNNISPVLHASAKKA